MTLALLVAGLSLGGCAAATTAGGGGPVVSPTGKVYEPGTSQPRQTRFTQAAILAIAQTQFEQAMQQARDGIASDSTNPQHYYLAGEAAAGLDDYALADSMWIVAERIFPAYELEVEPSRESAWAKAFNVGVEAYNAGNAESAIEAWRRAHEIYILRPEAAQNLGILLAQEERYDEAIAVYREAIANLDIPPATRLIEAEEEMEREAARQAMLDSVMELLTFTGQFEDAEALIRQQLTVTPDDINLQARLGNVLSRLGRNAEATEIYTRLLAVQDLPAEELFNIGVALFGSEDYVRAAEAFSRVTQIYPEGRDAWYNQANALYAGEAWAPLVPVAERLVQVDPLSSQGALILARAFRETGDNARALATLERNEAYPVFIEDLSMRPGPSQTAIQGRVIGNAAPAGTPITLLFTFYGTEGVAGTQTVTVNAPAAEQNANFEVVFMGQAVAYKYVQQ
jgi:tetratricopeptide (TPR) repeat protein